LFFSICCVFYINAQAQEKVSNEPSLKKIKDIVIYNDPMFYRTFPSIIKRPDGELLLAFRRAPERRAFKEKRGNHVDPNSYIVMMRSKDGEN
jgi:hypothetical protein